ncbi:efflux RND transporter periplasmic adaptor subunit [Motiliproteus sp. SC1-56]|uniref:efflux RND transporter periplasmic adaptor subunit n=1 Tax=Motiliproteus sp. SC1-56 TaxID=2799565 RepID=UPI001A8D1D87|nr:efflux RND transporter periplasmic adaptor subunit [Motiliproteus sp. SC1-56]
MPNVPRRRVCLWLFALAAAVPPLVSAQGSAPPVVVTRVQEQPVIESLPLSGTVTAPRSARLSPGVAGLVERVEVDAGDRVEAGALLLTLDPALARWSLDMAAAASEQAREELADARRRLEDVQRLESNRAIARTELHSRKSEVSIDQARVRLREAERRIADERLKRHNLRAPFAGVISRKHTEAGEWVNPGDPVLELVADRELRVDLAVPQRVFPRIDAQTRVELRLDALNNEVLPGRIGDIVPVSDPQARTFLIHVYPEGDNRHLIPGMSTSATLYLDTGATGLVVHRDALLRHPDGRTTAWVVTGQTPPRVEERQVKTGLGFNGLVEVREGLQAGDQVVVEGNEALQPEQAVTLQTRLSQGAD